MTFTSIIIPILLINTKHAHELCIISQITSVFSNRHRGPKQIIGEGTVVIFVLR